ncbi:MAG: anion permease [Chromatiales bacterium]|nr:anion permease [Chromatiales bacterium]
MADQKVNTERSEQFDLLDMHNYRIEKLPKRSKGNFEKWLTIIGPPLAIISFVLFAFIIKLPFLQDIDPARLTEEAKKVFDKIGPEAFSRTNAIMLGIFLGSIILWIIEAIPNYLTSLIVIIALVLTGVLPEKKAYARTWVILLCG